MNITLRIPGENWRRECAGSRFSSTVQALVSETIVLIVFYSLII